MKRSAICVSVLLLGAMLMLGVAETQAADPAPIVGHASVIDGDTIEIHGTRIRLFGIDAPQSA